MVPAIAGNKEKRPIAGRQNENKSSTAIPMVDSATAKPMSFLMIC